MAVDHENLMMGKSSDGLQAYLDNYQKYTTEAVEAAVAEMQKRGRVFTEEELIKLRTNLKFQEVVREEQDKALSGAKLDEKIVDDQNAPEYYSERAIYIFSALFSVLFGAVLLAINLRNTRQEKAIWEVAAFSIFYTGVQIWILSLIPGNNGLPLAFSLGGALLMNHFFWKKYIGENTKYRAKPLWVPLIIGFILVIPWLLLAIPLL